MRLSLIHICFPTCTDGETIEKQIKAAIGSGAELTDIGVNKPFYIEADTPAIKAIAQEMALPCILVVLEAEQEELQGSHRCV